MMDKHQIFETWILEDASLTEDEAADLAAHLVTCEHCRQLKMGWGNVREMIKATPPVSPAPGFSQRWKNSLAERRALQQKAQVRKFFRYLTAFILISVFGLLFTVVCGTSPVNLMATLLRSGVTLLLYVQRAQNVINMILRSVPLYVPVIMWILVSTGFSLAALAWGASMWKYVVKGVNAQ
jgi:hypothetical protein